MHEWQSMTEVKTSCQAKPKLKSTSISNEAELA